MSGFAGVVRADGPPEGQAADRPIIEAMAGAIAFRGPDALQVVQQTGASFAFSFLRTGPGRQESSQPCTIDGETWLLGDVRCDGREELAVRLRQHGVEASAQDSHERLVLQAFAQFGEAGLAELQGDLSFVLWNAKHSRLLGFRDLTGARPFFYACRQDGFLFSNTLQAILAAPSVSREFDERFLADFLLGFPNHDPAISVYRDIRRLPPGHLLEFSERGIAVRRIAHMPVEDPLILRHDEEYCEEFRRLLKEAVRDRLPSVDATIFLSGGLDSPSIAACAVTLRRSQPAPDQPALRAYSVDFQPLYDDRETELASRFAASLGMACEVHHLGDVRPYDGWREFPALLPEPPLDPYAVLALSHPRRIALTSRVGFSGMGCDELLRLQAMPYLRYLARHGRLLGGAAAIARYTFSERKLPPLGAGIRHGVRKMFGKAIDDPSYPPWLEPGFERRTNMRERWRAITAAPPPEHPFNPKAYSATNGLWVGNVIELQDPTWTACHMELRAPFLDRRLARFCLRIPMVPWAMEKFLVRRSQIGILPEEIRLRPKTPVMQDALLLHTRLGNFNPVPDSEPSSLVKDLVKWNQLTLCLQQYNDYSLYVHLRPRSLEFWLENIKRHC